MDIPADSRKYRNPLSDVQDQILFFSLFIIGAIGIVSLKYFEVSQIAVTAFPVSLMLFYAVTAFVTKRYRIREDRVGDNVYYLGFLFTLISLAYALAVYDANGFGTDVIITNFGIAIFTTILGLAGRVFFNQMREDPVEYEREVRYALAEASTALRSQLGDISTDLSSFKRKLLQILEEGLVDISNSAKTSMAGNARQFSLTTDEVLKAIQAASKTFTDHSSQLNEAASKTVVAVQALFRRIESIEASPELFVEKLDPIIRKFDEIASEAARRNKAQTADVNKLNEMIAAAVTFSEVLRQTSEAFSGKMQKFFQTNDLAITVTAGLTEKLKDATIELVGQIGVAKSISAELNHDLKVHRESVTQTKSLINVELETVQQHRDAMAKLVHESQGSVKALQDALVSLSKTLTEELRGR